MGWDVIFPLNALKRAIPTECIEVQQVWDIKTDLWKIKMEDIDLPDQNKLSVNKSLCPHYKVIGGKSKNLHSLSKIHSFFISCDTIKIRVTEKSSSLFLTHVDDFGKYFSDVDLLSPKQLLPPEQLLFIGFVTLLSFSILVYWLIIKGIFDCRVYSYVL